MQPFRVLSGILDARQRRRYAWLQTYFVLAAVMQMASVASLAPFIALVSQPQLIQTNSLAHLVYQHFGFSSDRSFLIAFAIALMVLIAISNLVPAVMSWLMWSFSQRLGAELQADMFRGVMHGDLASYARVNSAELVRNVLHGTNRLVYMVVQPVLNLVSSTFVIVLITAGLVIFDPLVAVVAAVLIAGGYAVVFLLSERRLAQHGTRTWRAVEQKTRLLNESFGGLREIRLAGTAERYERRLDDITKGSLRSEAMLGMLGELPRYVLETIALCALLGLGVYLLLSKRETSSIVAILSLYAMAGYRLLPAAQIAFRSATTIRANVDALQSLEPAIRLGREVEKPSEPTVKLLALGAVEFRNVGFHYPGTSKPVLEDVSFRIEPNTITAIVGTSGSGKSTIASLLLGLLRPADGDITVAGQSIRTCTRSWQDRLAYVSQHVFLVDDSIATNIALGSRGAPDLGRVERAARQASLSEFIESLPARYDHGVGEHGSLLSGGQRQRIGIARALYNDADVIVLDEPTSALDSATEAGIIATLEGLRATKTIVMISHRMSTLRSADRILMLEEGRVHAFGTFDELFERVESFRKLVLSEVTESAADGTGRAGESISATA